MRLYSRAASLPPLLLWVLLAPVLAEAAPVAGPSLACSPVPVNVTGFLKLGSEVKHLTALGPRLFLATNDPLDKQALRVAEQMNGSVQLRLLRSWAGGQQIERIFATGDKAFFVLQDVSPSLWRIDAAGVAAEELRPADNIPFDNILTSEMAAMGGTLFFVANRLGEGFELWKSDGTSAGTQLVKDIHPGPNDSYPQELTVMGDTLFFKADDGASAHGIELWKSDGVPNGPGTRLVTDIWGSGDSNPTSLTVMNGKLFFTAATGGQAELWSSDGTNTERVVSNATLGTNHSALEELTVVGSTLFFHMDDLRDNGDELWRSDGTETGTGMVKDIQAGPGGSAPQSLVAVGGTLFFMANDNARGLELWRTDGTANGTVLAKDFFPGMSRASEDAVLAPGPGALLVSVNDGLTGQELWKVNRAGAERLTDIVTNGNSAPLDMTRVGGMLFFTALYPGAGRELVALPLNQVDCLPPQIVCPGNLRVEASGPRGVSLFLPAPKQLSEDDSLTPLTVTYEPAARPFSFLFGQTPAKISVSDAVHTVECPFTVTVEDTTAPTLVCPRQLVQEAAGPGGTSVFFPVKAVDAVTASPSVSFSRPSGSVFLLGQEELITATAVDAEGNTSTCGFSVVVKDTVPPRISCPPPVVRVAVSAEPVPITYPPPMVEDAVGVKEVLTDHLSGGLFRVGVTPVTLTAVDTSNNAARCTFSVYNQDTIAPSITCPGPQQVVATGDEGAAVSFPEATAEDVFGAPSVSYSREPGSTFPVGETVVTATARDVGGNEVSCTFPVTVLAKPAGFGCQAGPAGASVFWLVLVLMPLWARRRAARLAR